MGICSSDRFIRKEQKENSVKIDKSSLSNFKKQYYNEATSSMFGTTAATSSKQNVTPEEYTLNKFGIQVKSKEKSSQSLKFIVHLFNFKCKLLIEDSLYILQIIFDGKEFPLSIGRGINPSFVFDETFGKEITFEKMSTSYLEIYLYNYKGINNNYNNLDCMTTREIFGESQLYSCFKINLLTIALAPEKHDIVLVDPKRIRVQMGRISYCVNCKHISDLNIKINGFKIHLKNLKFNEIALRLKFENKKYKKVKESLYTDSYIGIPNNRENIMIYEANDDDDDSFSEGLYDDSSCLSESSGKESKSNIKDLQNNKTTKTNKNKSIDIIYYNNRNNSYENVNINNNLNNSYNNKHYTYSKIGDTLQFHGEMCLYDLFNSIITLNIYSVRLLNNIKDNDDNESVQYSDKILKKNFFMTKLNLPDIAKKDYSKRSKRSVIGNFNLITSYELIGMTPLNFYIILHDMESKLSKMGYSFFQSMTNKKNGFEKTLSGSKIMKCGVEEDLTYKAFKSNKNIYNNNHNEIQYKSQNLNLNLFESESLTYNHEIFFEGELLGNIEINLEVNNLPLIRQIKFGVMTETGFELNSIFLYDNLNISNDLPEELLELIKLKEKFKQEIDFSILKNIKNCLEKTIDEKFLYYGFSSNHDLYQGQAVMIDLGLGLFDLLDKVTFEYLQLFFEILKLILKRSEFDLSTLSVKWFKPIGIIIKKESVNLKPKKLVEKHNSCFSFNYNESEYEFHDNYLVEKNLIEKFLNFHYELLNYCLKNLYKGNNMSKEIMNFTYFYLSISFIRIPPFRESFIKTINKSIDKKNVKYIKFSNYNHLDSDCPRKDSADMNSNYNLRLWDSLFYKRLESSINQYIKEINKDKEDINNKNANNGLEKINAIKEQLMKIKYLTDIDDKISSNCDFSQQKWYIKLSKRDFIFYDLIVVLCTNVNNFRNKLNLNSNQANYSFNCNNHDRITNIYGMNSILDAINYDMIMKDVKNYPKQIKEIIPLFYTDMSIVNNFITIMLSTTNVYDTISIFSALNILDYFFNKTFPYFDYNNDYIKDNIDYRLIKKAFFIIINSDNSLSIAKFIWFYYKNISNLNFVHTEDIITSILTTFFFKLFFHWSFQIREIFYFFIIFILGYKLKKQIKCKPVFDNKPNSSKIITNNKIIKTFRKKITFDVFANNNEEKGDNEIKSNEIYYVEQYLTENLDIISELQKIIGQKKYNLSYKDNIENLIIKKKLKILDKIPIDPHGNIIECIQQYENVLTKFLIWKLNNEQNKITDDKIEYPKMEITMIKDDTIQYES